MMFQPVGGMDRIAYALAGRSAPGRLRYRLRRSLGSPTATTVSRWTTATSTGGSTGERADFCVAAMPPHLLARLRHNLGTPVQLRADQAAPARRRARSGLEYGRRWWEEDERIFGGITTTDLDVSQIWYPSYGFFGERGVLLGYYNRARTPGCTTR